jgi:GxxExxY protein
MIRSTSPLDAETERLVSRLIACGIQVHRELGPGFLESVYRNAYCVELECCGIPFISEKAVTVRYRGRPVAVQRIDLIVANAVIVELKAVTCLEPIHSAQVVAYLRATGFRIGLLMNFGGMTLREGLKRIVV